MIEQEQIKPEEKRVLRSVLITLVYITVVLVFFIADLIALMIFSDTR
jgi:positive regulator of sigma E activity